MYIQSISTLIKKWAALSPRSLMNKRYFNQDRKIFIALFRLTYLNYDYVTFSDGSDIKKSGSVGYGYLKSRVRVGNEMGILG